MKRFYIRWLSFVFAKLFGDEERFKKFYRAVEQSPDTIIITDRSGRIEYVNPRFTQLTGYTRAEVIGQNPRILQSGKTPAERYRDLWAKLTSGQDWHGEFINKKKNGEFYYEYASISPVKNTHHEITHFVGILEDITERKEMEKIKDELVGIASHELRTPLTIIRWSIENLNDGLVGSLTKEQGRLLSGVQSECARLDRVIHEILDLTKWQSRKEQIGNQEIDLRGLIDELVQNFLGFAQEYHINLLQDVPEDLPCFHGNPDMILRLLRNLLDNALRFARETVVIMASSNNGEIHVDIKDDGPGIAKEDLKRLFRKFECIQKPSQKNGYRGTGLGLAICQEIVKQHSGKIWVESFVGKGTDFHFTLPVAQHMADPNQEVA